MYPTRHQPRQKDYAASPSCRGRPNDLLAVQRALHDSRKENYHLQNKIQQIEDEKLQLEEKCRQMEAQNKNLEERQQRQPDITIINEGWGIKFGQARDQIVLLIKENKQKSAELKEMSNQLKDSKATVEKTEWDLQYMDQRNRLLQKNFDEAVKKNKEILQQKEEQEKKQRDMEHKLKVTEEKYRMLKEKVDDTLRQNKDLLQEKERLKEEKCIVEDFEGKNLKLQQFCSELKDKTSQLEREKEKLDKQCSHMQKRMDQMARNNSELTKGILLEYNNLKRKHTEMQAQKQEQDNIHDDLQRTFQDIHRRNEELQDMYKEVQQRNADMHKDKLMQEETSKELREKLEEKRATLEEVEKTCKKLEKQNKETIDELRTLILEKKALVEKCMKKKNKRFRWPWTRDSTASSPGVASSCSTSVHLPNQSRQLTVPS
ncbi:polyamine-modulated factor 1-binding protein 1 [Simochromis diagramma]|uniref:polyamine-modulated factor 1-binding protein 1 n=1 Tax=Simochromis diagramma TaxID=43689 RepID=UPI001A7EE087|nr:polyamine-modulated factor 1-binding protein 1 [Simochromis diagramma]